MRNTIAEFFVLESRSVPAIEAAADAPRPWLGPAPVERALRTACTEAREFAREGIMVPWVLFYLHDREAIGSPHPFFQAPLSVLVSDGLKAQARGKTHAALTFGASDAAELLRAMSAVDPTEADVHQYCVDKSNEALNFDEAEFLRGLSPAEREFFERDADTEAESRRAELRLEEDESMPELAANGYRAFQWLRECLGRIEEGSLGLVVVRGARRRRMRWLTPHSVSRG